MLRYSKSDDGGLSFSNPINPAPNDPQGKQDYPFLTVSHDNHAYISYLNLPANLSNDISGSPSVLRVVTPDDVGNTFKNSTIVDHSACQCCATVVKFGPDNQVYVTSRSTFQNDSIALNDSNTPYQFPDGENRTIIRDITVSHSTDGSEAQNFSNPVRVGNDRWFMNGCPDSGPGMDFDKNGTMHIDLFTGSEFAPQGPGFYYTTSNDAVKHSTNQYLFIYFLSNGFHQQHNI